jgi:hypothetical protein
MKNFRNKPVHPFGLAFPRPNAQVSVMRILPPFILAAILAANAQTPPGSIVNFEIEDFTIYDFDCPFSQLGQSTNRLETTNATGVWAERLALATSCR